MAASPNRRSFLKSYLAFGGGLAFLDRLPPVAAQEAKPDPAVVRLESGIEPLVRLLEETPREKLLEEVGGRIKKGLTYRDVLAALLLAGVRNIQPRPASASSSTRCWWSTRPTWPAWPRRTATAGCRSSGPSTTSSRPRRRTRRNGLADEAGERVEGADAGEGTEGVRRRDGQLGRGGRRRRGRRRSPAAPGRTSSFELFARYGCRDFRDIGHKAIYVANAWRTLHRHRLAARRAGAALAGLRPAQARRQKPREEPARGRRTRPAKRRAASRS